jgi:hypothetical protein
MKRANKLSLALLVGLSIAALTSSTMAQGTGPGMAARDAAISKCVKQAQSQYPDDSITNQRSRADVYKSCMNTAGFAP